jgi:nitrile hydratase subunit alpha
LAQSNHRHNRPLTDVELRVKALESLLTEKQLIDQAAVDEIIETYEHKIGPRNGARVVARAWLDPAYKQRLLDHGTEAIAELGLSGVQGEDMVVVENTDRVHNLVVCTLCSCYPWPTAGLVQVGALPLARPTTATGWARWKGSSPPRD